MFGNDNKIESLDRYSFEVIDINSLDAKEFEIFSTGLICGTLQAQDKHEKELAQTKKKFNASYFSLVQENALLRVADKHWRDTFNGWSYKRSQNDF